MPLNLAARELRPICACWYPSSCLLLLGHQLCVYQNTDVAFSSVFYQYRTVMKESMSHYTPARIFTTMIYGHRFPTAPKRAAIEKDAQSGDVPSVRDFWRWLREHFTV